MKVLCAYLAAANIITALLYGADKAKARRGAWRIPERVLLGCGICGGALGALLGMPAVSPQDPPLVLYRDQHRRPPRLGRTAGVSKRRVFLKNSAAACAAAEFSDCQKSLAEFAPAGANKV